jgi:hypothetical protein
VTVVDGQLVKIISETIRIFPKQSFDKRRVLYDITGQISGNKSVLFPPPVSPTSAIRVIEDPCDSIPDGFFDVPARIPDIILCKIHQIS